MYMEEKGALNMTSPIPTTRGRDGDPVHDDMHCPVGIGFRPVSSDGSR